MSNNTRSGWSNTLHSFLIMLCFGSIVLYILEISRRDDELRRFEVALEAADAGRWYWDLKTDTLECDTTMLRLLGRDKSSWSPRWAGFESIIIPEDRERVRSKVEQAIKDRGGYQDVFGVVTEAGEIIYIRASAMVSRDGQYMAGVNLPAIPRNGNFKRTTSVEPSTLKKTLNKFDAAVALPRSTLEALEISVTLPTPSVSTAQPFKSSDYYE